MTSPKRVFYVVYSKDEQPQRILDAMCYLADPNEKNRAHVTLRGPYPQRRNLPSASRTVEGADIEVTGVDAFFRPGQNTVFFAVEAPELARTWYKPDFPEYKPHLTIYDGPSREFAERLRRRLRAINPRFHFQASSLAPLVTRKGQGSLNLRTAYDEELVRDVTGKRVSAEDVPEISEDERIDLIADLCSRLVKHGVAEAEHRTRRRPSL